MIKSLTHRVRQCDIDSKYVFHSTPVVNSYAIDVSCPTSIGNWFVHDRCNYIRTLLRHESFTAIYRD